MRKWYEILLVEGLDVRALLLGGMQGFFKRQLQMQQEPRDG